MKDRNIVGSYGNFVVVLNKNNKSGENIRKLTIIIKMYYKSALLKTGVYLMFYFFQKKGWIRDRDCNQ